MPFFLLYELTRPEQINVKNAYRGLYATVYLIIFAAGNYGGCSSVG